MTSPDDDAAVLPRWVATIEGKRQRGFVEAENADEAARLWAERIKLLDAECTFDLRGPDGKTQVFAVEAEVVVTYRVHERPQALPKDWAWEFAHGAWQARSDADVLVGYGEDGLEAADADGNLVVGDDVTTVVERVREANKNIHPVAVLDEQI